MTKTPPLARSACLLIVVACALGAAEARDPAYVSPDLIRSLQILPAPPAAEAAATQTELADMRRLAANRSQDQVAKAQADDQDESIFLFNTVLGPAFSAANLPITAAFSAKLKGDASLAGGPAKNTFQRAHPYHLDATLNPVCPTKTRQDSYPSGHTLAGYFLALALIDLVPEQRDAILARAGDYANNRVICGVNFPSDLQASKLLAYASYPLMAGNAQYRQDMAAARSEVRKALNLPPVPTTQP